MRNDLFHLCVTDDDDDATAADGVIVPHAFGYASTI
jgi:hypothetical protein